MKTENRLTLRKALLAAAVSFGYLAAARAFTTAGQAEPQPAEISCFDAAYGQPCRGAASAKPPIQWAERAGDLDFDLKAWAAAQAKR